MPYSPTLIHQPPVVRLVNVALLKANETVASPHRRFAAVPRPFLKWAGSKQALLQQFIDLFPARFGTYYEPFLGSAAVFFYLKPTSAVLSDACSELVDVYGAVRDDPGTILRYLAPLKQTRKAYYEVRENRSNGRLKRAAEFIYLNKTCWNGLYRVNSSGEFNVPFGAPKTPFVVDRENLQACAKLLRQPGVSVSHRDFEKALETASKGDLVYLDPPYVTGHNNNGFRDWNETLFSWQDQCRLAETARELKAKGATVIVSNADHKEILKLYKDFKFRTVHRSSTLASAAKSRRVVSEVVIHC